MGIELLPACIRSHYECHEWKHACAILHQDFPAEWRDLLALLTQFRLSRSQLSAKNCSRDNLSRSQTLEDLRKRACQAASISPV